MRTNQPPETTAAAMVPPAATAGAAATARPGVAARLETATFALG